jgi:peptide/nickel transport system substrate-binding protein
MRLSNHESVAFRKKAHTGALVCSLLVIFGILFSACGSNAPASHTNPNTPLTIVGGPGGDYSVAFSPYTAGSVSPGTQGLIYETLLMPNELNGTLSPWLATSYDFSSDAKTLTFHIRQNVKWSDGQPFTANDVAFSFNLLKQYPAADTSSLWATLQSVTATDQYTVTLVLQRPYSPILYYVGKTFIVPQHIFSKVGDPTKYTNPHPVGTGPYVLKSFTPQLVTLQKNPNYWGTAPQVNLLNFPAYDSNQSVELDLDRGNIDWAGVFTPNIQQTYVNRDPSHFHYWFPASSTTLLYLNLARSPFNQLAVRQAISLALDRQKMATVGESGYSTLPSPTGLVLPNQQSYLASQYSNLLLNRTNITQANQLMQSAGFTKGSDGIYVGKDGKKLSFSIIGVTGWTDEITDDQIIAESLKQIGMSVTVNSIAYNNYFNDLQMGNFDMALNGSTNGVTPFYFYDALLNSKDSAPIGQQASTNWERWQNPTTDSLLSQYTATTDLSQQKQIIQQLEQIMVDQIPAIPLFYGVYFYEYSTAHFVGWPTRDNPYAVPAPWAAPDYESIILHLKPA